MQRRWALHYSVSPLWLADPVDREVRHRRNIRPALPPTAPNTAFHATVDTPDIISPRAALLHLPSIGSELLLGP